MLARSVWQLVGFVAGAAAAAGAIVVAAIGLALIGTAGLDATRVVITMGGALLVIGWGVAPLLAGGVDTTVDAERLAPFPMSTRQVMIALAAIGFIGLPGIASTLGALSALAAWVHWPAAFASAIICLPLGVLTCVLVSRTVASFSTRGGRRLGNMIGLIALAVLVLAGPIVTGLVGLVGGTGDQFVERAQTAVAGISWTPIGAVWAVPGDLAAGEPGAAGLKLLIALATLAVLWVLWRRNVRAAALAPRPRATVRSGHLGVFGALPTGGTGASWARSLQYWLTDPRYTRNLLIVALLPLLLGFALGGRVEGPFFAFVGVLPALLLGLVPYADVAFDGTAFATVLATGIRGRADRAGRLLAAATVGLPLVVIVAVASVAFSGEWMLLPGVLGCCISALLIGLGVCAVSSAYIVIPVPASGDNIFKRVPGATFTTGLALMGLTLLAGALTLPSFGLALGAAFGLGAAASWAALVVGVAAGVGVAWGGIVWGGRIFDRTGPLLLARVRATVGY
jgi:ABC-2 type transport system permease protein